MNQREFGKQGFPAGIDGAADCLCMAQLRHVLPQLMERYAGWTFNVYLRDGVTVTGVPRELIPGAGRAGLLRVGDFEHLPLREISAVRIPGGTYDESLDYLPAASAETLCDAMCEAAIRATIREEDFVQIRAGGQIVASELIVKNELGMIVTACFNGMNPTFIVTCHINALSLRH